MTETHCKSGLCHNHCNGRAIHFLAHATCHENKDNGSHHHSDCSHFVIGLSKGGDEGSNIRRLLSTGYLVLVSVLCYSVVTNLVVPPMRSRIGFHIRLVRSTRWVRNWELCKVRTQCMLHTPFLSGSPPPSLFCVMLHVFLFCASPIRPVVVAVHHHDDSR